MMKAKPAPCRNCAFKLLAALAFAVLGSLTALQAATTSSVAPISFSKFSDYDSNFKVGGPYKGISCSPNGYLVKNANGSAGLAVFDTSATDGVNGTGGTSGTDANNDLSDFTISAEVASSNEGGISAGFLIRLNNNEAGGYLAKVEAGSMSSVVFSLYEGVSLTSPGTVVSSQRVNLSSGSLTANTFFPFSVKVVDGTFDFNFGNGNATKSITDATVSATTGQVGIAMNTIGGLSASTQLKNFRIDLPPVGNPLVTTGSTADITTTSATISGTVNPNGLPTTAKFEYGLTPSYGSNASVMLSPTNGTTAQNVSASLVGLQKGVRYYYRLIATNSQGTNNQGGIFTTNSTGASWANGGFESGNLTGWITPNASNGSWRVYSAATSPLGLTPEGNYSAVAFFAPVFSSPGTQIMYQDIAVPAAPAQTLSLRVCYSNTGNFSTPTPNTLDYTAGSNQQYRIDLMDPSAAVDSLAAADVLATVFATNSGSPGVLAPTLKTYDLSPFAGKTVRLRIAVAAGVSPLAAAIDDIRLGSAPVATTGTATAITATSATLNATVNPNGLATTAKFEYGLTTAYGGTANVTLSPSDGWTAQNVSVSLGGLQTGLTYHYRLASSNAGGTGNGTDATFATLDTTPPTFTSVPTGATVRVGSTVPNLAANAMATDNSPGPITITQSPVAGSIFSPVGPFSVTLTASDPSRNSANATVNFTVRASTPSEYFSDWAGNSTLSGGNAAATATPFGDGVPNLLKYAFNMNGSGPDARVLVSGTGTAGLPTVAVASDGTTGSFRIEFVRRIGAGLFYLPEMSATLSADSWTPFLGTLLVTPIDAAWERAIYLATFDPKTTPRMFGRVKVVLP